MMSGRGMQHMHKESQTSGTYILFTIDENDYLTLYKIKSYLSAPMSSVITNFKMAKKTSVLLEYPVQTIEWMRPEGAKQQIPMMGTNGDSYRRSKHLL